MWWWVYSHYGMTKLNACMLRLFFDLCLWHLSCGVARVLEKRRVCGHGPGRQAKKALVERLVFLKQISPATRKIVLEEDEEFIFC